MPILGMGINLVWHFTCNYNSSSESFRSSKWWLKPKRYSLCQGVAKSPSWKITSGYPNQSQKGATAGHSRCKDFCRNILLVGRGGILPMAWQLGSLELRPSSKSRKASCFLPTLIWRKSLSLENWLYLKAVSKPDVWFIFSSTLGTDSCWQDLC